VAVEYENNQLTDSECECFEYFGKAVNVDPLVICSNTVFRKQIEKVVILGCVEVNSSIDTINRRFDRSFSDLFRFARDTIRARKYLRPVTFAPYIYHRFNVNGKP